MLYKAFRNAEGFFSTFMAGLLILLFMKEITLLMKSLVVISVVLLFAQCGGEKAASEEKYIVEKNPPFEIIDAYSQDWVAGIPEGGSGTNVHITLGNFTGDVVIQQLYFNGKVTKMQISPQTRNQYVVYFKNDVKRDVIMDIDPVKEAQNHPEPKFPFTLGDGEAILSYLEGDQTKYTRVKNIRVKEMLAYPSTKPNDEN